MKKLLPILVVVMLFVAGGVSYFAYDAINGYMEKDNVKGEPIQAIATETESKEQIKVEDIKIENTNQKTSESPSINKTNLNQYITISLDNKYQLNPDMEDVYSYGLDFTVNNINHTEKEIKGFQSILHFNDMFNSTVKSINYKYEFEPIPMKGSSLFYANLELNRFDKDDMRLYSMPLDNIVLDYEIISIVFSDGSTW